MKHFIKAEWELYKKNTAFLIMGLVGLFIYGILLLFTGVGGAHYAAAISLFGYMVFLFFFLPLYFSPASHWKNKAKVVIPMEQLLLTLGESKRMFVKIRMFAFGAEYIGLLLVIALMQLPAFLIAGEKYSLWFFGIEVITLTFFAFLTLPAFLLLPYRGLNWVLPLFCGFGGGFGGGLIGDTEEFKGAEEVFGTFAAVAIVGVVIGFICMLLGYLKALRQERRGVRKER